MEAVGLVASIPALVKLAKDVILFVKEAKDASAERQKFIGELSGLSGLLSTLCEFINDTDPANPWRHGVEGLTVKGGPLDQFLLALLNIRAKVKPGSSMRKFGQALAWKLIKDDINNLLSQIERVKSLIVIALDMDQMKLSRAIKQDLENVRTDMADLKLGSLKIQDDTTFLRNNVSAAQKQSVSDWLCPTDYLQQHRDIINRRTLDTGDWFLNAPEFQSWEQSANDTLFCPGDPGVGKTIMSAIVVEHLLRTAQLLKQPVVFIYFNYKQQADQTTDHIVLLFLRQIVDLSAGVPEAVMRIYHKHKGRRTTPSPAESKQLLETVVSNVKGLSIITDALDESDDTARAGLFGLVKDLREQTKAKFLATSRNYPAITSHDLFFRQPSLEIKASAEDLEIYLRKRFVGFKAKLAPELQEKLVSGVVAAVGGMFLLARLLMDSFQDKIRIKTIKADLAKLPTGLDAYDVAYENAMERIKAQPQEMRDCATKALSLIMCAKRPLRTSEVTYALMLEPGDTEIDEDNELDIEVIVASSAALLTVDEESQTVSFVHYTTQEYLQRMKDKWLPRAEAGVIYMCTVAWEVAYNRRGVELDQRPEFEFYASDYGLVHVDAVLNDERYAEGDHPDLFSLLRNAIRIDAATSCAMPPSSRRYGKTSAHWSASKGLTAILGHLISEGVNVDLQDSSQQSPLMIAVIYGQNAALSLLLQSNKVNVNAVDKKGETALLHAIHFGKVEAVRILLDESRDIDLNHRFEFGRSVLHRAVSKVAQQYPKPWPETLGKLSERHHAMEITKLLVDTKGLDINSGDSNGITALSFASRHGLTEVVDLILGSGKVNVDSRDPDGRSPLTIAAVNGKKALMQWLIAHGATVNSKCLDGKTALLYAAQYGKWHILGLLLHSGASVNTKCNSGMTALHYAAKNGMRVTLEELLGLGAPVDTKCNLGMTALHYAAKNGKQGTLEALLDSGAPVNTRCNSGMTAFHYAAKTKKWVIVRLLVKMGADRCICKGCRSIEESILTL